VRFALVTSEVNYVRDNYRHLLESILERHSESLVGLVVVKTVSFQLVLKAFALGFLGCRGISANLFRNILKSLFSNPFLSFERKNIPIHHTPNINSPATLEWLRGLNLDLLLNVRTRNIFRKAVLQIPRWGSINIHHGILPENRGTMCDLWALYEWRSVGYSIHWMNAKIDDGALIRVSKLPENLTRDYGELPYLSSLQEARDLNEILDQLKASDGKIPTFPNHSLNIRHTKNPTRRELSQMRGAGVRL
jgi:hypothetical protein